MKDGNMSRRDCSFEYAASQKSLRNDGREHRLCIYRAVHRDFITEIDFCKSFFRFIIMLHNAVLDSEKVPCHFEGL